MQLSKLISELQKIYQEKGDMSCEIKDRYSDLQELRAVYVVDELECLPEFPKFLVLC